MNARGILGIIISVAYFAVIGLFYNDKLGSISDMKLNNLGDFLAGVFGPVAILWLILGYFQQGAELRNSIKALELQTQEMNNSVTQQRELARVSNEQFKLQQMEFRETVEQLNRSIQPKIIVTYLKGERAPVIAQSMQQSGKIYHQLAFANLGGVACEVSFWIGYGSLEPDDNQFVVWPQFEVHRRHVALHASDTHGDTIQICVEYKDANGKKYCDEFGFVRTTYGDNPRFEIRRVD